MRGSIFACSSLKRVKRTERSIVMSVDTICNEEWWMQPWLPEEMEKLTITMADFEVF